MPGQLPAGDRRAVVRVLCPPDATARVSAASGGPARWARVLDATRHGLGLLLPAAFDAGTVLVVGLHRPGQRYLHPAVGRVAHATPRPDGSVLVGCALAAPLPAEVLRDLTGGGAA